MIATVQLRALALLSGCLLPMCGSDEVAWESSLTVARRTFDLEWRTAAAPTGNGANPPFTATWDDIAAIETTFELCVHNDYLHLRAAATYGRIDSGSSSISAFADDTRAVTTYRSDQRSDDGDTREGTLALGLRWHSDSGRVRLVPEVGFTRAEQHLTLTEGVQVTPASGPYAGLDSRYRTSWQGTWLGLSGAWEVAPAWALIAHCRYQWVDYRGELDLNLRTDLAHPDSIEQAARGYAVVVGAGVASYLSPTTEVQVLLSHEDWRVADGRELVNYQNGSSDAVPLNSVTLSAWVVRCGLRWEY